MNPISARSVVVWVLSLGLVPSAVARGPAGPTFADLVADSFSCAPIPVDSWPTPVLRERSFPGLPLHLPLPRDWPDFAVEPPYRATQKKERDGLLWQFDVQELRGADVEAAARGVEYRLWGENLLRPACRAAARVRYAAPGWYVQIGVYSPACHGRSCQDVYGLLASDGRRLFTVFATVDRSRPPRLVWPLVDAVFRGVVGPSATSQAIFGEIDR